MLDRQTEHLRVIAGEDVTEVAGRHAELDFVARVDDLTFEQLRVRGEIVDDLRHQTAHVDGVGRREHNIRPIVDTLGELMVAEDTLDGTLCVVEIAAHRAHVHVRARLRGHLQLLDLADLAFRVEHGDARARHVGEPGQRGLARVARGGREDHDFLVRIAGRGGMRHKTGKNLQSDVLERGRRAVEQFEDVIVAQGLERCDRRIRPLFAVGVAHTLRQLVIGEIRQQRAQHLLGDLLVGLAGKGRDVDLRVAERVGDEQAAVVGDALADGLLGSE